MRKARHTIMKIDSKNAERGNSRKEGSNGEMKKSLRGTALPDQNSVPEVPSQRCSTPGRWERNPRAELS
jgi:hypothetical protein